MQRPQANWGCEQGLRVNLVLTRACRDKFPGQIPATILESMDKMESLWKRLKYHLMLMCHSSFLKYFQWYIMNSLRHGARRIQFTIASVTISIPKTRGQSRRLIINQSIRGSLDLAVRSNLSELQRQLQVPFVSPALLQCKSLPSSEHWQSFTSLIFS